MSSGVKYSSAFGGDDEVDGGRSVERGDTDGILHGADELICLLSRRSCSIIRSGKSAGNAHRAWFVSFWHQAREIEGYQSNTTVLGARTTPFPLAFPGHRLVHRHTHARYMSLGVPHLD
jgi:hypothetical protein